MKILDDITLLTCTFNNNMITMCMIMSCFKQLRCSIPVIIIDNGKNVKCDKSMTEIFDIYDLSNSNLTSSSQHAYSIDYALKKLVKTKYVILCDNDILFKPELHKLIKELDTYEEIDCVGEIGWDITPPDRLYPYFCIINVEKFNKAHLNYYDDKRIIKNCRVLNMYDTGYSFYEDIKKTWKIKQIKMNNYMIHLHHGSLRNKNPREWLSKNKKLWSN